MDDAIYENYYNILQNPTHITTSYVVKPIDPFLIIDEYKMKPFVDPRSPRSLIELESDPESESIDEVPVEPVVEVKEVKVEEPVQNIVYEVESVKEVPEIPVEQVPVEEVPVEPVEVKEVKEPVEKDEVQTIFKNMLIKAKKIYTNREKGSKRTKRLMHHSSYTNMY